MENNNSAEQQDKSIYDNPRWVNELASIAATITRLRSENALMKEKAKDLCWQCWNMFSGFNLETPLEEFEKREKHFEDWWEGKQLELTMPNSNPEKDKHE